MDPKCVPEFGEALCNRCLEAGGFCASCVRELLPRIAVNRGWLKLMAAAAYRPHVLAETPALSAAGAAARRREARKAAKAALAKTTRITKLISGQYHRAAPRRALPALSPA